MAHHAHPTVTEADLREGFGRLGLTPGCTAMVHSSLSAFGHVEGGAEAVIRALLTVLSPGGTLVLPTLCQKDRERREETWNIATSPSDVGRLTEVFRTWPGAVRSDHFTHSVAALGPAAEAITAGHATAGPRPGPWGPRAFGHGSPWEYFHRQDVLYCFLGVTLRVNTMRHLTQSMLLERGLEQAPAASRSRLAAELSDWNRPGLFPAWSGEEEEELLAGLGLLHYETIGAATCRSIGACRLVDEVLRAVQASPERWLQGEMLRWYRESVDSSR